MGIPTTNAQGDCLKGHIFPLKCPNPSCTQRQSAARKHDLHVVPAFEEHDADENCRCGPYKDHTDADTGVSVWVHRVLN